MRFTEQLPSLMPFKGCVDFGSMLKLQAIDVWYESAAFTSIWNHITQTVALYPCS